ncbi:MAG: hypothetical protein ACHQEB_02365 [Chitinophagales bacterium]
MKPITNRLASIAGPAFFPLYLIWRKAKKKAIFFLVISVVLASCFQHYYRTNTQKNVDAATVQNLLAANKYFIVHFGNTVKRLLNVSVTSEKLEADIEALPLEHSAYINPDTDKTNRVKYKDKINTLAEVHLYTTQAYNVSQTHLSIPLSSFNRMDIYTFDAKATTANHILSILGSVIIGGAVLSAIIVAIACNCPQVFVNNNGQYEFVSGVYSGSTYSSLERTDYLPLPLSAISGNTCQLKIANVKNEEQFINREQLLEVSHPAGTNVLADRHGTIFSYDKLQAPASAIINQQTDIKNQLETADNDSYLFDSEKGENGFSNVVLTFNKPADVKKAKLIVHGGNSTWSGYLYHSFTEMFGNGYEKWRDAKDKSDPKEMEQWQTDQELPLMVYIEKNGRWELADYFAHTGNTATRDMIMELNVSDISSSQIKIKLETVYQFWNLDFAGVDFSDDKSTVSKLITASSVIKNDGTEQKESLSQCDKQYCHLGTDENIILQYPVNPSLNGSINSYFLVSSGYYHNLSGSNNKPQTAALLKFKNKGAFDEFSRNKFSAIQNNLVKYAVKDK